MGNSGTSNQLNMFRDSGAFAENNQRVSITDVVKQQSLDVMDEALVGCLEKAAEQISEVTDEMGLRGIYHECIVEMYDLDADINVRIACQAVEDLIVRKQEFLDLMKV